MSGTARTAPASLPDKICAACGRSFAWRKRWARTWAAVRFCSAACRRDRSGQRETLGARILALLDRRAHGATICPSEVLPPEEKQDRARMEAVRRAARLLVHEGAIEILQRGRVVDPDHARGPIRLRRRAPSAS